MSDVSRPKSMYPPGFSNAEGPSSTKIPNMLRLPPILRMLLVADGTVTKLLEAYFWDRITVRVTAQRLETGMVLDPNSAPQELLFRDVIISRASKNRVLAFATSVMSLQGLSQDLRDDLMSGELSIGAMIRRGALETYREQLDVGCHSAGELGEVLGVSSSSLVAERTYRVLRAGRPLVQITEAFAVEAYVDCAQNG